MSREEKEQWLYETYQYTRNFDFNRLDRYKEANDDICIDDLILNYTMLYEFHKEEIERLNKRIEDLNTINEEHRVLNGKLREELEFEKATNKELLSTGAELENKLYEEQDKNKRLNNIINKALGIANERFNYYYNHKSNNEEHLEDWENIFNVLLRRDNE